jgi:hypothetical protein
MEAVSSPIFIIFGLAGFVGGLVGYFAKGRADAIIKGQAQLIRVRDTEISDKDKQVASLTAERDSLVHQNETLKGLAQGSPQLASLTKEIKGLVEFLKNEAKK